MASRLTPIGWIAKFLLVPAALGGIGFCLVGPRIGAVRPAPKLPIEIPGVAPIGEETKPTTSAAGVQSSPPAGVEVSVKPVSGAAPLLGRDSDSDTSSWQAADDTPKPRVRRGKLPASMVAPPTDPQPDEDGSGH